jgi:zinc protease
VTTRGGAAPFAVMALAVVASCAASTPRAQPAGGAGLAAADEQALRAHPPAPEPPMRFKLPEPYVTTLPNGMRLVVIERHIVRVVAAEMVVRGSSAGLSHEPPAAGRLMESTITSGTLRQNEMELFQEMNQNAIVLSTHTHDDWFTFDLRAPSTQFDRALTLLRDVALQPTFPADLVDVARRRLIGNEPAWVNQPSYVAQRNLFAALYGLGHPYTLVLESQARELQSLTRDDVVRVWRDLMDPAEATLVVAGDVNPVVVRQSVATLFGGWAADPAKRPAVSVPAPETAGSARIIAVDRPGARQVTILYGGRGSDDSLPHDVARALADELIQQAGARSKSAATGGEAGANWSVRRHVSWAFAWQRTVAPDQVGGALRELDGWIGELRERGPDANDLKMARARVTHRLPRAFETIEQIAATYGFNAGADRPLDWLEKFEAGAAVLPWEEIRDALPVPEQMRVVVVGNLAALMDQLLSLGWGPVEVHDADGHLLRTVAPGG